MINKSQDTNELKMQAYLLSADSIHYHKLYIYVTVANYVGICTPIIIPTGIVGIETIFDYLL